MLMKRMCIIIFALCILLSFSSCSVEPDCIANSSFESADSVANSVVSQDDSAMVQPMQTRSLSLDLQYAKEMDVSPLYYTGYLGSRETFPKSLPTLLFSEYPYLYYDRMGEGEDNAAPMTVGRYSFETKKSEELVLKDYVANDGRYMLINPDSLIYKYNYYDANGQWTTCFELLDFPSQNQTKIVSVVAASMEGDCARLNEHEIVIQCNEKGANNSEELILRYNLDSGECTEIYRDDYNNDGSTRDIWAFTASNNRVYLLMQQIIDGRMHFYLRILNQDGEQLSDTELEDLAKHYPAQSEGVDQLHIHNNQLFLHFAKWSSPTWSEPSLIALEQNEGNLHMEGQIEIFPYQKVGESAAGGNWICFNAHRNPGVLFWYNTQEHIATILDLGLSKEIEYVNAVVDPVGSILIFVRNKGAVETKAYYYPSEYVQKQLEKQ